MLFEARCCRCPLRLGFRPFPQASLTLPRFVWQLVMDHLMALKNGFKETACRVARGFIGSNQELGLATRPGVCQPGCAVVCPRTICVDACRPPMLWMDEIHFAPPNKTLQVWCQPWFHRGAKWFSKPSTVLALCELTEGATLVDAPWPSARLNRTELVQVERLRILGPQLLLEMSEGF